MPINNSDKHVVRYIRAFITCLSLPMSYQLSLEPIADSPSQNMMSSWLCSLWTCVGSAGRIFVFAASSAAWWFLTSSRVICWK